MTEYGVSLRQEPGSMGPRRSLILTGGALQAAYQSGVVRALDEASLTFHHADATSGGAITLAMLLSGRSPEEMCERWFTLPTEALVSLLPLPGSLSELNLPATGDVHRIVDRVFPHLGVDVDRIRASRGMAGTFNVANFTRKTHEILPHEQIDTEWLVASLSMPILMPPVRKGGDLYTDAVWTKGVNLLEAVRRGSDELWVVWYVTNSPAYEPGILQQCGHMAQLRSHGALFEQFERIQEINRRIEAGDAVYGHQRPIRLHLLKPTFPLPFEPEYYLGRMDPGTLVALGYRDAHRYLASVAPGGVPADANATAMIDPPPGVTFRETLTGPFTIGVGDPDEGARRGAEADTTLTLAVSVFVRDMAAFTAGAHTAELVGSVSLPSVAHALLAKDGRFTVVTRTESRTPTAMLYEVVFELGGTEYCLVGRKELTELPDTDQWAEATTLVVRLHVGVDGSGPVVGAGVLRLGASQLLRLLSTIGAPGTRGHAAAYDAIDRFGRTFLGSLWERYSRYAVSPPF